MDFKFIKYTMSEYYFLILLGNLYVLKKLVRDVENFLILYNLFFIILYLVYIFFNISTYILCFIINFIRIIYIYNTNG